MSSYGLWLSASGMKVNEHRQALLANNLANAETVGFKQDLARISLRALEGQSGVSSTEPPAVWDQYPGGLQVLPPHQNFAQGSWDLSGRPLDVAIDGTGFLAVSNGETTRYTRDGRMTLSPDQELVLAAGDGQWKVLDAQNAPIRIPAGSEGGRVSILSDGSVRQGDATVATLGMFGTENPQRLRKIGVNLFDGGDQKLSPQKPRLVPESTERSNVDVMPGLAEMLESSRAYELNANMIRMQDEATGQLIARVARVA